MKQALEERKREIQEDIEVKDERSRMVNTEKEEIRRLVSREVITPKIPFSRNHMINTNSLLTALY